MDPLGGCGMGLISSSLQVPMIGVILRSTLKKVEPKWLPPGAVLDPLDFLETKPADQGASEYYPNHCHMERAGSKTHPVAAQWLHIST